MTSYENIVDSPYAHPYYKRFLEPTARLYQDSLRLAENGFVLNARIKDLQCRLIGKL
jgi:hypothetical protein